MIHMLCYIVGVSFLCIVENRLIYTIQFIQEFVQQITTQLPRLYQRMRRLNMIRSILCGAHELWGYAIVEEIATLEANRMLFMPCDSIKKAWFSRDFNIYEDNKKVARVSGHVVTVVKYDNVKKSKKSSR